MPVDERLERGGVDYSKSGVKIARPSKSDRTASSIAEPLSSWLAGDGDLAKIKFLLLARGGSSRFKRASVFRFLRDDDLSRQIQDVCFWEMAKSASTATLGAHRTCA